jgi:glycosyltransferase involved in cell wall biosynthesis
VNHISVVMPAFNEAESLSFLIPRVVDSLKGLGSYEILVVDDASTDQTTEITLSFAKKNKKIKLLRLASNSGHMAALTAGLEHCSGNWVVTLDADGQDPPELIPEMLNQCLETNSDICFMVRKNRANDPIRHRVFSPIFYSLLQKATRSLTPLQAADFRIMSGRVVKVLNNLPESNKVYRVLVSSLGFKTTQIEYLRSSRLTGESKYGFTSLVRLALRSFMSTTGAPLRWLSSISIATGLFSFSLSGFAFLRGFLREDIPGWASIVFLISILMTLQALSFGILSEFMLLALADIRRRPTYQVLDSVTTKNTKGRLGAARTRG